MNHVCVPPADPRGQASCLKCGRPIVTPPDAVPVPMGRQRDIGLERDLTEQAARHAGVDPQPIISMAEARTLPGPLRDFLTRRFDVESHEETADCRNYLCWWILQILATRPDDDVVPEAMGHITQALAAITVAHTEITRADRLLRH